MSQLDLIAELRRGALAAPPELRERVRFIASQGPPSRRRITRRRTFAIAVPILAAAAVATVVMSTRSTTPAADMRYAGKQIIHPAVGQTGANGSTGMTGEKSSSSSAYAPITAQKHQWSAGTTSNSLGVAPQTATTVTGAQVAAASPNAQFSIDSVTPAANRAQRYSASLALAVASADDVVSGSKRAVQIAQSEGGFLNGMNTNVAASKGYADLTLRVPRNVQQTISRLSSLGTVTGMNVTIKDLQGQLDSSARLLHRLRNQLADLQAQPQTTEIEAQITALEARIGRLQRGHTATVREATFATVYFELATKGQHAPAAAGGHGPFHNIGTAFRAIGIGLVYGLAFGLPLLIVAGLIWLAYRAGRKRRENALLGTN